MSAFVTTYPGIVRALVSEVGVVTGWVGDKAQYVPCKALWDTGAVYSVISSELAKKLGLVAFDRGRAYTAQGSYATSVYLLDVMLPNQMVIKDLRVSHGEFQDFDFLIGMDIIAHGDLNLSNARKTRFAFRIPSEGDTPFNLQPATGGNGS